MAIYLPTSHFLLVPRNPQNLWFVFLFLPDGYHGVKDSHALFFQPLLQTTQK